MHGTTNGLLIVVAQDEPGIYRNLCRRFEGAGSVRIVRDRRLGDRRRTSRARGRGRRSSDRRGQPGIEQIGRASCWGRVEVSGGAGSLKKKEIKKSCSLILNSNKLRLFNYISCCIPYTIILSSSSSEA